ncbi:MAG: GntR family transcriptional regulator, partial [Cetobacterium somerae]|uniref:GntR family transcriptional regulator n=1 Tax=Cetobacterium somerae TaxID=188913 RepID=UPI003F3B87A2
MNILFKNFKVENENFIYISLYIFLKDKIEKREISYKLPSIRKVANFLNISSNTVAKSYLELEKINYVKTIKGSGVFINKNIFSEKNISSLNLENDDNFSIIKTLKIDFINSTPNYSYLPVNDIKYAINYILDRDQELALINEGPFGSFE